MEHNQAAQSLAGLLIPQRNESNPGSMLSVRQPSTWDSEQLQEFLGQMASRYPHQDVGASAMDYLFDCNRLMEKHGLSRIKTALLNLRIRPGQRFFPRPDEIAEELETMAANEKADALKENPYVPDPECTHVSGGYFQRYVDKEGEFAVRRCSCWLKWKCAGQPAVRDHKAVAAGA